MLGSGTLLAALSFGCSHADRSAENAAKPASEPRVAQLMRARDAIVPFYSVMHREKGDWLESHQESGETFEEYIRSDPVLPTPERKTVYIQPIGSFTDSEKEVIRQTADYMRAFFNLPVILGDARPIGKVPDSMTRTIFPNDRQIRTSYFLEDVLPGLLPEKAAALICLTNFDLYPEETWAYVFGQASLDRRVGVWSLWRLQNRRGRPDKKLFLTRTLKIAMHETGHMFSMRHCTKYECLMSGTNNLLETDRRPIDVCPECMAKIAWAMKYDPADRYRALSGFWRRQGAVAEAEKFSRMAAAAEQALKRER